jgi:hypothetical protein
MGPLYASEATQNKGLFIGRINGSNHVFSGVLNTHLEDNGCVDSALITKEYGVRVAFKSVDKYSLDGLKLCLMSEGLH